MRAYLILENGTMFYGKSIGAHDDAVCELVFYTGMTGYGEVLTDSSYAGQGVVMTYPLIGNCGINNEDIKPGEPFVKALVVRELAKRDSNFRSEGTLGRFLEKNRITGIEGVDTREIAKHLREKGTMNALITTNANFNMDKVLYDLKKYKVSDIVPKISTKKVVEMGNPENTQVAVLDLGSINNIVETLVRKGFFVKVYPYNTKAEDIIKDNPAGIVLSNGPGDPKELCNILDNIKKLYETDIPIFAISLGHQLIALATGADTRKLKRGHYGANYPVLDILSGRTYITGQNHSYVVDEKSIDENVSRISHININDKTIEGLEYVGKKIFTFQFNPMASSGPKDTTFIFDTFLSMMGGNKYA